MFKKACPEFYRRVRPVLSGGEGKAAAVLTRGAYSQYVSASGAKRQVCEPEGQAKGRRCLCEPLWQSQGTPLAAFFNIPLQKKLDDAMGANEEEWCHDLEDPVTGITKQLVHLIPPKLRLIRYLTDSATKPDALHPYARHPRGC